MNPYRNPKPSAPNPLPFTSTIEGVAPGQLLEQLTQKRPSTGALLAGFNFGGFWFWDLVIIGFSDSRL